MYVADANQLTGVLMLHIVNWAGCWCWIYIVGTEVWGQRVTRHWVIGCASVPSVAVIAPLHVCARDEVIGLARLLIQNRQLFKSNILSCLPSMSIHRNVLLFINTLTPHMYRCTWTQMVGTMGFTWVEISNFKFSWVLLCTYIPYSGKLWRGF